MGFNITQIVNKMLGTKIEESSIAVPVDIQGVNLTNAGEALPVTVVNSVVNNHAVEVIDLVASESVRNSTAKTINLPDLSKYVSYDFYVLSTLDQPVRIAPWYLTSLKLSDGTIGGWGPTSPSTAPFMYSYRIPAKVTNSTIQAYWLSELSATSYESTAPEATQTPEKWFRRINAVGADKFQVNYVCGIAPTSGVLTIRLIGRLR